MAERGLPPEGRYAMKVSIDPMRSKRVLVELCGALNRDTVPGLRKTLLKIARNKEMAGVDLDLSRVDSMDTSGIALVVELVRSLSQKGREFALVGRSEGVERMIRLARLENVLIPGEPSTGGVIG